MTLAIFAVIIFILGLVSGVVLTRYGFGLGIKAVYQIKEDMPLETPKPREEDLWQENTSDEEQVNLEEDIIT